MLRGSQLLILLVAMGVGAGCGNSGGPDPKVEAVRRDTLTNLRSYYDRAGGDYARLSAADKAEFVRACGGEKQAEQTWALMKNGATARPPNQ
jgi:hypothetical protein